MHLSVAAHCVVQLPQANPLAVVSTQKLAPPKVHDVSPGLQAQVPEPLQYCERRHVVPQAPQLSGSSTVSVQLPGVPPHTVVAPVGQLHALLAHDANCAHRVPHVPQLVGSVEVLVQTPPTPPQSVFGVLQTQAPATQLSPGVQRMPQPPQLLGSMVVLVQVVPHVVDPVGQLHTPEMQVEPTPHLRPQAPQLFASEVVSTHDPPQTI